MTNTFCEIIDRWPSKEAFAEDIGVPPSHARVMHHRGRVDSAYWARMVKGARARRITGVTLEILAAIDEAMKLQRASEAANG